MIYKVFNRLILSNFSHKIRKALYECFLQTFPWTVFLLLLIVVISIFIYIQIILDSDKIYANIFIDGYHVGLGVVKIKAHKGEYGHILSEDYLDYTAELNMSYI